MAIRGCAEVRSITDRECVEWLESNDIDAISNRGFTELTGDYEVFFAAPKDARAQQNLARELVDWVGPFDVALLRVTDWPAFKPEEMAILLRLRLGHAEDRRLID